jgi:hypothetical protein
VREDICAGVVYINHTNGDLSLFQIDLLAITNVRCPSKCKVVSFHKVNSLAPAQLKILPADAVFCLLFSRPLVAASNEKQNTHCFSFPLRMTKLPFHFWKTLQILGLGMSL